MDRAGADYDEETVVGVGVLDDGDGLVAAGEDGGARAGRLEKIDQPGTGVRRMEESRLTWGISCWRRSGGVRGL